MSEKLDFQWNERFASVKSFIEINNHYPSSEDYNPKVKQLGKWIRVQRQVYKRIKKGKLTKERIELLESLPDWKWDYFKDTWTGNFEQVKKFLADHNRYPSESSCDLEEGRIARWVNRQRKLQSKKTGLMNIERIKLLESLPGWFWYYDYEAEWLKSFYELKQFILKNGYYPARAAYSSKYTDPDIKRLANWISIQRMAYKEGKVSPERMMLLEGLPRWKWNVSKTIKGKIYI